MKNLFLLTVLSISLAAYSQKTETVKAVAVTSESIETENDSYKVRSKEMVVNEDEIIYKGSVVLITDLVTLEADKVVLNRETKEVTATGNFRFKGVPLKLSTETNHILKYKIGDTVAYLE